MPMGAACLEPVGKTGQIGQKRPIRAIGAIGQ
jgi:hypothetical protein